MQLSMVNKCQQLPLFCLPKVYAPPPACKKEVHNNFQVLSLLSIDDRFLGGSDAGSKFELRSPTFRLLVFLFVYLCGMSFIKQQRCTS